MRTSWNQARMQTSSVSTRGPPVAERRVCLRVRYLMGSGDGEGIRVESSRVKGAEQQQQQQSSKRRHRRRTSRLRKRREGRMMMRGIILADRRVAGQMAARLSVYQGRG